MKRTIGAIALVGGVMAAATAIALAGSTAFAGERFVEQRAELAELWGKDTAVASQAADTRKNFTGISSIFGRIEFRFADPGTVEVGSNYGQHLRSGRRYGHGAWSGNYYRDYRGGRLHPDGRLHPGGR